jgi:glycogen debranching enzyme
LFARVDANALMAKEVIRIRNEFYIRSSSARVDVRPRVLKQGDMFAVFDRFGDIETFGTGELGLYYQDTRFLSRLTLRLGKDRPLLLSSTVREDNAVMAVDATNPDGWRDSEIVIPRGTVHVFRSKILWDKTCHERLRIHNYGRTAVDVTFAIEFDADFADIFELRGMKRECRGRRLETQVKKDGVVLAYEGLDNRVRRTRIIFDPPPTRLNESVATFQIRLEAGKDSSFRCAFGCEVDDDFPSATSRQYEIVVDEAARALERVRAGEPQIFTGNEQFNDLLNRSLADLHMMRTETAYGPYPYAGVPWFSTVFGRDGIITALQCLWFDPSLARGVLAYLAATQADAHSPEQDAEPGKVLHETRADEMATLGEVPFRRYYGSIDATPLFIMLAGAYYQRTADHAFLESVWPNIERGLAWIDRYGDSDGDGFMEYARKTKHGLIHQGWKDSVDAVFHSDGASAEAPIALCEVQGYVYAAKTAASELAKMLGDATRARELSKQAEALRRRFDQAFWCDELSTYALALDGNKQPCRVRTSNPGHCLFAGIARPEHARRVAATLIDETSFSGWGVRTVACGEARYNPMSYHNGSVWPHDNSLIAAGFARYGLKESAAMILAGLLDASLFFDLHRLPELFCGFPRRAGESPTLYPVACAPQAWASGAVLLLLEACLGLTVSAPAQTLIFSKPILPAFLPRVSIRDLKVGDARVDLLLTRHDEGDVGVNVLRRDGALEVLILK